MQFGPITGCLPYCQQTLNSHWVVYRMPRTPSIASKEYADLSMDKIHLKYSIEVPGVSLWEIELAVTSLLPSLYLQGNNIHYDI